MTYSVRCPECGLTGEIEDLAAVLDLQDVHREKRGETHIFDFDLI